MVNQKSKQAEDRGFSDTYILKIKMKGHRTWRIAMCNRNVKKISRALDDLAKQITNKEILKMDGETGKIELINV